MVRGGACCLLRSATRGRHTHFLLQCFSWEAFSCSTVAVGQHISTRMSQKVKTKQVVSKRNDDWPHKKNPNIIPSLFPSCRINGVFRTSRRRNFKITKPLKAVCAETGQSCIFRDAVEKEGRRDRHFLFHLLRLLLSTPRCEVSRL